MLQKEPKKPVVQIAVGIRHSHDMLHESGLFAEKSPRTLPSCQDYEQGLYTANNPCVKFYKAERGYILCDLTPERWISHYKVVDEILKPGGKTTVRVSFRVNAGDAQFTPLELSSVQDTRFANEFRTGMTDSNDWQTHIQKHLDGQTSEKEATALSEQIVRDEGVRSAYLKAARIHGALGDETLALDLETIPFPTPELKRDRALHSLAWPKQLSAAIITGAFVLLTGVGLVLAVNQAPFPPPAFWIRKRPSPSSL